tara:strand:- start:121 stop:531 length:411 start_codon:yes stop_codon:yes gene_type:complete
MLSVQDVEKIEKNRRDIKKTIYKKIYEQLSKKIKNSVELGHRFVCLRIPPFLMGQPAYDARKASVYIMRQFRLGGFKVYPTSSIDMVITWDIKKSTPISLPAQYHQPVELQPPVDEDGLPSLINLKKLASQYKNAK